MRLNEILDAKRRMKMRNKVSNKNAFVKKEQDVLKTMMGERPTVPAEMKRFDAFMSNNAETAQAMCTKLTSGLDKKAFPVS